MYIIGRILSKMAKAVILARQSSVAKKSQHRKSPYSMFIIKRNNYSKRGNKSLVGTTIITRPSWSKKEDDEQE